MKRDRKTPQVMVDGTVYRMVPLEFPDKGDQCTGCVAKHDVGLCIGLPDCCSPAHIIYVERKTKEVIGEPS